MLRWYHLSLYHAKYTLLTTPFFSVVLWYVVTLFRISESSRLCAQTFFTSLKRQCVYPEQTQLKLLPLSCRLLPDVCICDVKPNFTKSSDAIICVSINSLNGRCGISTQHSLHRWHQGVGIGNRVNPGAMKCHFVIHRFQQDSCQTE